APSGSGALPPAVGKQVVCANGETCGPNPDSLPCGGERALNAILEKGDKSICDGAWTGRRRACWGGGARKRRAQGAGWTPACYRRGHRGAARERQPPGDPRRARATLRGGRGGVLVSSNVALFDAGSLVTFFEKRAGAHSPGLTPFDWLFTLTDVPHVVCGDIAFKLDIPANGILGHANPEPVDARAVRGAFDLFQHLCSPPAPSVQTLAGFASETG
ncbi:hypothetical protein T484DRAFT_1880118, partial [Baffinella frigidus]